MFDPFGLNNHINSMLNGMMMDPFMSPQQQQQQRHHRQQMGGNPNSQHQQQLQLRSNPFDPFAMSPFGDHRQAPPNNPFALMHHMMGNMDGIFRNFDHMGPANNNIINADPSSQVFSSSSVITYSSGDGSGRPKVFQQSKQMRQGPGGVKETREMVRDSEKGIEQMAIGHHIGEKSHVIERKKYRDGQMEEVVNLENLDDG